MILINCNQFLQGAYSIRDIFINFCDLELAKLQRDKSLGLSQLLEIKNIDLASIKRAFRNITISGDGYLFIPEHTDNCKLLRYLEYGGEGVRATHLISSAKKNLINTFSMKGDRN